MHHTCQNEYDNDKYENAFETMNNYKKRCRVCVDIAMDNFTKGKKEIHRLMLDNNPCVPIDIGDDNEEIDDVESDVV